MRLIDLDSDHIQETIYRRGFKTRQDIEEWLNFAPIIDAVPVVRCKDCKYHEDEEIGMVYCPNAFGGWVRENWFCADGKRKEGADNG